MIKRVQFFVVGFAASALFIWYTLLVKQKLFNSFDFDTTVRLQNHIAKKYDLFLSVFSLLGSFEILSVVMLALILIQRKLRYLLFFVPYLAAHFVELIGKSFMHHPGPPFLFFRYQLGFLFPSSYVQTGSSYPSGHSFRAVYVVVLLLFFLWKSKKLAFSFKFFVGAPALFFVFIMLLSRVSLGEHWTTDVVGGTLLAIGVSCVSLSLFL